MATDIEAVAGWQTKQVINWFKGLDDGLQCYIPHLEEATITGAQLLALNYEDLDNLGIHPIGHQELVLEATDLLKQLHFELDNENLQSRALDLNCRCRTLRSSVTSRRRNDSDATAALQRGSSIPLLRLSCDVLDSAKLLIMWLDRPPFFSNPEAREIRAHIVKLSHELSTTVQQSVFTCVIEDAATSICSEVESLSNQLIVSNDPMTIQPSSLEVAHLVNRDPLSGLGLFIKATFEGHHVITGTKEGSISSKIRRITPGDEVVAIGGQTVVGWQLPKLVAALKESPNDVSLTLKKRPHFSTTTAATTPTARRQHQDRILTVPPPISPIRKVADSRKNSVDTLDGGMSASDMSRNASQENLFSPKKSAAKKKKKLKKQKAKSSSNILAAAAEGSKKSSNRNSVNSFGSSIEESLRSASSSEAMLSVSTGNLSKNFDIRKSLEKALRKERRGSTELLSSEQKRKKPSQSSDHDRRTKKGKSDQRKQQQEMMPNVNDILEELRTKRLKRRADSESTSKNSTQEKTDTKPSDDPKIPVEPMATEPPSSPLDFLTIPPPPEAPYTPRTGGVLQVLTDESSLPSSENPTYSASESPNSLLDTEHRRRFTIIGSEQMDDKWFNSLLSEVNAKRSQRAKKASARQVLERLDETTASEDSVFASRSLSIETKTPAKMRPPKPKRRNRPVSMPPNYYSPSKLNQYRTPPRISEDVRSGSLIKIAQRESTPVKASPISPIAHRVDENGVKKLAPLNCSIENVPSTSSSLKASSLEKRRSLSRESPSVNSNNNNSVGRSSSQRSNYKTPPKPPRRSLSITERSTPIPTVKTDPNMPVGRVKETGERLLLNLKPERPRSTSDDRYVGLLQVKHRGISTPTEPVGEARQQHPTAEAPNAPTPTRLVVASELNKYFRRKTGTVSSSSDQYSPADSPSPAWMENDAFSPRSQPSPSRSPKVPLMPPVAKPRSKVTTPVVKDLPPPPPPPPKLKNENALQEGKKVRSKSVDSAEVLKTSTASQRRQSQGISDAERSNSKLSRTSTSRGSYVAAMDGAFSYENMVNDSPDGVFRRDSDGYAVKVVDGVKVRLRKNTAKSSGKKKGRLKIIDHLKSSPDMRSNRRISCRDLGSGECNGWLWKKKHSSSPLSSKWSKRWVILKDGAIYCYHSEDDDKAESYISLPGYKVTPAPECKRKFAFRCQHPHRKTFYFASDRQMDMSRWMNKLGLAAIEYGYTQSSKGSLALKDDGSREEHDYYSESESEDASFSESGQNTSQSGTESSTPNSSPEKLYRSPGKPPYTIAGNQQSGGRHMSTQPDLNRSARFPKNKAVSIAQATDANSTQTDSSRKAAARNRSKSEGVATNKEVLSTNSNSTQNSVEKPAVMTEQRKHKAPDTRRKQFLDTSHLSASLEAVHATTQQGLRPSHSDEELRHLHSVAVRKAEEVAQREKRSSSSSLASSTSTENLQSADKKKKFKGRRSRAVTESRPDSNDGSKSPNSQQRVIRRDVAGRPKLKVDASQASESVNHATTKAQEGSIGDLSKALHDADVDIHGVNRRTTLRRKMTVLSKNPKRNELMLKKRSIQRQIKALEGELAYYNCLDEKNITSEVIHKWINQHPSLVADLGTIRRMSKRRKAIDRDNNDNLTTLEENEDEPSLAAADFIGKSTADPRTTPENTFPIPAKRGLSSTPSNISLDNNYPRKHSDSEIPSTYSLLEHSELHEGGYPNVRPRSCAISGYEVGKMRSATAKVKSPSRSSNSLSPPLPISPNRRPYLETDL